MNFKHTFLFCISVSVLFSISPYAQAQTSLSLSGANGGSIIVGNDTDACNAGKQGAIRYNTTTDCAEYCDSTQWVCPAQTTSVDNVPDSFDFTDNAAAPRNQLVESDVVQITGLDDGSSGLPTGTNGSFTYDTSISGQGSPEYRICSNSTCSSVVTTWTSGAATIENNQYVQLRLTSDPTVGISRTATFDVAGTNADWVVTPVSCAGNYTFNYIGALQTLAIGSGCNVQITLDGAGGGACDVGCSGGNGVGGDGGRVTYEFNALSAGTLDIIVGSRGETRSGAGYGGGGDGGDRAGQGGGRAEVSFEGTLLAVAGGGGGGGSRENSGTPGNGGDGGATVGQNGGDSTTTALGGTGATNASNGNGGWSNTASSNTANGAGYPGSGRDGGDGGDDACCFGGGGGGAGYFGGGGGGGNDNGANGSGGGGGGGSNHVNTGAAGYVTSTSTRGAGSAGGTLSSENGDHAVITVTLN